MKNKHSTHVKTAMSLINEIVNLFKYNFYDNFRS